MHLLLPSDALSSTMRYKKAMKVSQQAQRGSSKPLIKTHLLMFDPTCAPQSHVLCEALLVKLDISYGDNEKVIKRYHDAALQQYLDGPHVPHRSTQTLAL